jgi:DNA ligase (NAD+)
VLGFFASDYGKAYLERLLALGIDPQAKPKPASLPLAGLTFVLTGTLSQPRRVFEERIKEAGGIIHDSVSKLTRYLLAGTGAGIKIENARTFGTEILDESGLDALLGKRQNSEVKQHPEITPQEPQPKQPRKSKSGASSAGQLELPF